MQSHRFEKIQIIQEHFFVFNFYKTLYTCIDVYKEQNQVSSDDWIVLHVQVLLCIFSTV